MENVPARVRELTGGRGVDVVVEHVGAATWDRSLKCLARGGRLVTCGATTGHDARIDLRFLFGRQLSLLGSYMGRKSELLRAAQFFFAGAMKPVVDSTFHLSEAAAGPSPARGTGELREDRAGGVGARPALLFSCQPS